MVNRVTGENKNEIKGLLEIYENGGTTFENLKNTAKQYEEFITVSAYSKKR